MSAGVGVRKLPAANLRNASSASARICSADLILVAGEVAVIAALAVTILVKVGPAHYSAAVFSPASSPHAQLTDITNAMIYGITAFAGFETAAALGEEAKNTRRSIPAGILGIVIVTGVYPCSSLRRRCSAWGGTVSPAS